MGVTPVSVLAIYRGQVGMNRGTPLRVRAILEDIAKDPRFSLTVASWDEALPFSANHLRLDNKKLHDFAKLRKASAHAEVVLGHTMGSWYYLLILKLLFGKKIVLEMHGFLEEEHRLYGGGNVLGYWFSKLVHTPFYYLCSGIVTCGGLGTDILLRYNPRVYPMIGGTDQSLFRPNVVPGHLVKRGENSIVIGYAGNTRKWQGIDFLSEAFQKLHAEDSRFVLAVLSSEKKNLPTGSGVQVVLGVSHHEVPAFLAECDILVIPRLCDRVSKLGPPSKILEYMAMGKTTVVSAVGYMDVIITDKVNGRTFPPGDTDAFVKIMRELADPAARARLGAAAVRTVSETYTWEKELPKLTNLLLQASRS